MEKEPLPDNACPVPYVLSEGIKCELDRLQGDGIIKPITFSDWAAPTVPVSKLDGLIRICGDYKITVNKEDKPDSYPVPRIEQSCPVLLLTVHQNSRNSKMYYNTSTYKNYLQLSMYNYMLFPLELLPY